MAQSDNATASTSKQYAPIASIPFIKAPSLRTPVPIPIPQDVHPLPDDVTAYFVYPFTLEPHILTLESSRRSTLSASQTRNAALLRAREEAKERRKRDAMRKIAPGFEGGSGVLVPTRLGGGQGGKEGEKKPEEKERDVMDDLVDQLAMLDSARSSAGPGSGTL